MLPTAHANAGAFGAGAVHLATAPIMLVSLVERGAIWQATVLLLRRRRHHASSIELSLSQGLCELRGARLSSSMLHDLGPSRSSMVISATSLVRVIVSLGGVSAWPIRFDLSIALLCHHAITSPLHAAPLLLLLVLPNESPTGQTGYANRRRFTHPI
eukprot:COSAG02_NODE_2733_length_8136_cov_35.604454_11_plen_157_part_00